MAAADPAACEAKQRDHCSHQTRGRCLKQFGFQVWSITSHKVKMSVHRICVLFLTRLFRVTRILDWLVMSRMGALSISCSALWIASASMRIICQLISLNVRIWNKQAGLEKKET